MTSRQIAQARRLHAKGWNTLWISAVVDAPLQEVATLVATPRKAIV